MAEQTFTTAQLEAMNKPQSQTTPAAPPAQTVSPNAPTFTTQQLEAMSRPHEVPHKTVTTSQLVQSQQQHDDHLNAQAQKAHDFLSTAEGFVSKLFYLPKPTAVGKANEAQLSKFHGVAEPAMKAVASAATTPTENPHGTDVNAPQIGRAMKSGLNTIGNIGQAFTEADINIPLRNMAEGKGFSLPTIRTMRTPYGLLPVPYMQPNTATTRTVGKIIADPKTNWGQKLDNLGQTFGINSPGEIGKQGFWTRPGAYEQIMNAQPKTAGGYVTQLLLGARADFARWKAGHPIFTTGETLVLSGADPTLMGVGGMVKIVGGAAAHTAGEFSEAAVTEARATQAEKLAATENATRAEKQQAAYLRGVAQARHATVPKTALDKHFEGLGETKIVFHAPRSAADIAGEKVGHTFSAMTSMLGSAYTSLSKFMGEDMPIIADRYGKMAATYGPMGEFLHHGMVVDHGKVDQGLIDQLRSTDYAGGLTTKQLQIVRHITEHLNDIYAGGLNPKAQLQLQQLQKQYHDLTTSPINPMQNETPELRQGKLQHVQQQIDAIQKQRVEVDPSWHVPINGVSLFQRAENFSKLFMDRFNTAKAKLPVTSAHFMGPEVYAEYMGGLGHPGEGVSIYHNPNELEGPEIPQSVSTFWPHQTTFDRTGQLDRAGRGGMGGAAPSVMRRSMGKVSEATAQRPPEVDLNGTPTGRPGWQGMEISRNDDPLGDVFRNLSALDNYTTMIDHVHAGQFLKHPITKTPATIPVTYKWGGDPSLRGGAIQWGEGNSDFHLEAPLDLGFGPQGAKKAAAFAEKVAPYVMKKYELEGVKLSAHDAQQMIYKSLSQDFFDRFPTHLPPGNILSSPDLDGWATESTYLNAVADANPALRWKGLSKAVGARIAQEVPRFTNFQRLQSWNRATLSGVTPEQFAAEHLSGAEDDIGGGVGNFIKSVDMATSIIRAGRLYNFTYHPTFNSYPALVNLLLEHAGQNPVKMLRYTSGMNGAMFGATLAARDELLNTGSHAVGAVNDLIKRRFGIEGEKAIPNAVFLPHNIEPKWFDEADRLNVTKRAGGKSGMSSADYVRIMSAPYSDLPWFDQVRRAITSASDWNQKMTFDIMEKRLAAQALKHLVKDEGMQPEVAAREINKAINDYENLSRFERSSAFQRLTWFWSFNKMQLRRAAVSLTRRPQVLASENRALQVWNQLNGDQNANDNQIALPNGKLMSASMAPYKAATNLADLTGLGGLGSLGKAAWKTALGHLSPTGEATARGMMQAINLETRRSVTPNEYDFTSGLWDVDMPANIAEKQALQTVGGMFNPTPLGAMPTTYAPTNPTQNKLIYGASMDMRDILQSSHATPEQKQQAANFLDKLNNNDVQSALLAKGLYSSFMKQFYHHRSRSGWF